MQNSGCFQSIDSCIFVNGKFVQSNRNLSSILIVMYRNQNTWANDCATMRAGFIIHPNFFFLESYKIMHNALVYYIHEDRNAEFWSTKEPKSSNFFLQSWDCDGQCEDSISFIVIRSWHEWFDLPIFLGLVGIFGTHNDARKALKSVMSLALNHVLLRWD